MLGNKCNRLFLLFLILLLITGLSLAIFPLVWGTVVDKAISENAQLFLDRDHDVLLQDSFAEESKPEETMPHAQLWAAMTAYNEAIYTQGQANLSCEYSYQAPSFLLSDYGLSDEVFGVISIPRMELEMPIYLGATEPHMAAGVAHLSQTSLPIGGANTNCVIAGHRGYNGAKYFRYIELLQPGDSVTVTNLWETLHYRVAEIKIIDPTDVDEILIQPGRDLLTLLTCHPYASGGRQRYLVYCERTLEA